MRADRERYQQGSQRGDCAEGLHAPPTPTLGVQRAILTREEAEQRLLKEAECVRVPRTAVLCGLQLRLSQGEGEAGFLP